MLCSFYWVITSSKQIHKTSHRYLLLLTLINKNLLLFLVLFNIALILVTLKYFSNSFIVVNIKLLEQTFEDNKQRFLRIRIDLANSKGELKINSLVTAEIPLAGNNTYSYQGQIPASAVYRTGLNSFVWLKIGTTKKGTGIFQLRKVTTGPVTSSMTTVISGLSANQEVAEHAGSLTDSETFLNEN